MKIELIKQHGLLLPGSLVDTPRGVAELLIARGVAVAIGGPEPEPIMIMACSPDPDQDGIDEAGPTGEKKAFTRPPVIRSKPMKTKQPRRK